MPACIFALQNADGGLVIILPAMRSASNIQRGLHRSPRLLGLSQARRKVLKRLKQVDRMLAMRWQCDGIRARPMRRCASMQDAGQGPRASANFTGLSDVPGGNSTLFTFALNYDTAAGAALAQQRPSGIGDTHRLCFQTVFRRHSA